MSAKVFVGFSITPDELAEELTNLDYDEVIYVVKKMDNLFADTQLTKDLIDALQENLKEDEDA